MVRGHAMKTGYENTRRLVGQGKLNERVAAGAFPRLAVAVYDYYPAIASLLIVCAASVSDLGGSRVPR